MVGVFSTKNTRKLLRMWHIDGAWCKALNDHINDKQQRIEIYHQLRVLLLKREETKFVLQLQQLMSFLHNTHDDFYKYFNRQYVQHIHEWATCYRVGTIVNTNMYTESFHRQLKVVYFLVASRIIMLTN
uniref:Uncharacterized protein n=1 Tax=Amphimedon queenslandica TaxID=400682 RepID=A0A1X7UVA1_AMPQE